MDRAVRAKIYAALGDERRLAIFDELALGDHTVAELSRISGMEGNLLAHHLDVLEDSGLVERRVSEGDRRRRYVTLKWSPTTAALTRWTPASYARVAFICTRNSARSQFAAAFWAKQTGLEAISGGNDPADEVHPKAIRAAADMGVDLSSATPGGYERIGERPDLLISVCDRARESDLPRAKSHFHWSIPDPVINGSNRAFRDAFSEIAQRIELLASGT